MRKFWSMETFQFLSLSPSKSSKWLTSVLFGLAWHQPPKALPAGWTRTRTSQPHSPHASCTQWTPIGGNNAEPAVAALLFCCVALSSCIALQNAIAIPLPFFCKCLKHFHCGLLPSRDPLVSVACLAAHCQCNFCCKAQCFNLKHASGTLEHCQVAVSCQLPTACCLLPAARSSRHHIHPS